MIDVNTLQEPFLSQTAITLLEKRYLLKDKEGKIIETPRDMFFRVASFLASAELQSGGTEKEVDEWTLKFYNELVNLRFLVNSPSLMNSGTPHPMLSACFEKGTAIETDGLPKNIEDITIGDMVLTHQSRYKKVTNVMGREDTIFEVKIDKLPLMYVTAEHPFLTKRGWVKVKDLKPKDDFIEIGMRRDDTRDMIITFNGHEENGKIYKTLEAKENIKKFNRKFSLHENPIKNNVSINDDIAWLLGVFIADGSISQGYDIRITLGMHDVVEANRIIDIFKKEFDIEAKLITTKQPSGRKGDGWITVRVHNKFLSDWIVENFGKGFNKKVLPNWIFHLRDNLKMKFIEGVAFGDGTPINSYGIRIGLCNEVVVRQLFQLLTSIGYKPSLHKKKLIKNGKFHLWSVEYGTQHNPGMVKGNAYRLNYIKDTKKVTRVYNFEVEDDHTYVANQVIVHNCFILPVEDSIVDIYRAITDGAIITQRGGGIGYSLTKLRPENDLVGSTTGVASGPVSFAKVFNASIDALKQGGKRRGAMLLSLRIDHPDIIKFIDAKHVEGELSNANISVSITDKFMEAVKAGKDYELINPHTGKVTGKLNAKTVFNRIITAAHKNGEPGVIFIDEVNRKNSVPQQGEILSSNPCVTGDTEILTDKGYVRIDSVIGQEVNVWNGTQYSTVVPIITGHNQEILDIEFSNGKKLSCTKYHKFYIDDRNMIVCKKAEDLKWFGCDLYNTVDPTGDIIAEFDMPDGEVISGVYIQSISQRKELSENVYCFYEPIEGKGCFNGIVTGQCGEMMAIPYSICNLGSINLAKFVKDGEILWDELKDTVKIATRMLDNTISVNEFPIPPIKEVGERNRYIGLGVMGFADMLIQLGIPYDSEGGLMTAEMVMKTIYDTSFETSKELGKEKGNAPGIEQSIFAKEKYLRNLMHTVVAPTGSIGMIADTSAGIEPNFGMVYTKTVMNGTSFVTVNKYLEEALKKEGIYSKELIQKIAAAKSLKELKEIPKSIKDVFVTTMDVSPEYHVKMQAAIQKYTSSGVSKTVNAPNSSTIDDVYKTYMLSWELKCKGVTYYRDGSRTLQVLTSGTPEIKKVEEPKKEIVRTRKRPAITRGETHKISIGCGDMYVTVNEDEKGLCEVFISVGKSGGCVASQCEAIGRMISLSVRSSVQLSKVIDQLKGIRCPSPTLNSGGSVLSCADAIGKVLEIYMKNKKKEEVLEKRSTADMGHNPSCSECGAMLVFSEGCVKCLSCGFSKCS